MAVALASWDYFLGLCLFFHMHACSVFPSRCIPAVCFKDLRICDVLNEAALRLSSKFFFIRECVICFINLLRHLVLHASFAVHITMCACALPNINAPALGLCLNIGARCLPVVYSVPNFVSLIR